MLPYFGLVAVSLLLLIAVLAYRRSCRLIVLYFAVAGIIQPFEFLVLILLKGYRYLPGIVANPALDNYLGSYISSLIVPASAAAINAFSLSWDYVIIFAAAFTGIDCFFTTLGVSTLLVEISLYRYWPYFSLWAEQVALVRPPASAALAVISPRRHLFDLYSHPQYYGIHPQQRRPIIPFLDSSIRRQRGGSPGSLFSLSLSD